MSETGSRTGAAGAGARGARPLEGRSALVTGASRGIGRATVRALAAAGAGVHAMARSGDALEALEAELEGVVALPADLSRDELLAPALDDLVETLGGPPDVVVNSAGVFDLAPFALTEPGTLDRSWRVNLRGPFLVLRRLLPGMLERDSGTVVNVGSVAGRVALPGNAAYSASKFGLRGLHEVLLEEIRGTGVRATLVEPAATDTSLWDPFEPDQDPGLPDRSEMLGPAEVAEAIFFAATRPAGVAVPLLQIRAS